jgi:hypothetical protein
MVAQHDIGYLQALGITVYQLRGEKRAVAAPEFTPVLGQQLANEAHTTAAKQNAPRAGHSATAAFNEAQNALRTPASNDLPVRSAAKPAMQRQAVPKLSSAMPELVVPAAELARFAPSKLCLHLGIAILGRAIPAVENAVQSETALWFESPTGELKLGSLSLLRTSWRARRQAWTLLRAFRKLNPR